MKDRTGTQKTVWLGSRAIGFRYLTKGGFYRGYSNLAGMGYGPFWFEIDAIAWVRRMHEENERE